MELISRHAWLFLVGVTCANGVVWWRRGQKEAVAHPELAEGYKRLVRGWLLFANVPWLVMGAGIVFGGVPSIWHYFNPRGGPFVVAFYAAVVALWIALAQWVFVGGGAEALIRHPGLLEGRIQDPSSLKRWFAVALVGGAAALVAILTGLVRVPK
jgi:hypothetical protein